MPGTPDLQTLTAWGFILYVLSLVNPEAAAGAVCGGLFFWAMNPEIPPSSRVILSFASIGLGYGIGLTAARSHDWQSWAWFAAGIGSSMVHVCIVSLRSMVQTGSPLPPWMKELLAVLPWRKQRDGAEPNE